jgi:predicted nucleic acid-binding protein
MNENSGLRVFVDSNVLITAMQSENAASKDLPILVSAILAQPDVMVTGDYARC